MSRLAKDCRKSARLLIAGANAIPISGVKKGTQTAASTNKRGESNNTAKPVMSAPSNA